MKLKTFVQLTAAFLLLLITDSSIAGATSKRAPAKQFYELVIYHLKDQAQEERIDKYLAEAFVPAMHRYGIKTVGVFKTANIDTAADKKIYVLLTYRSLTEFHQINSKLNTDQELAAAGKDFTDAAFDQPAYTRKESVLMESFSGMPSLRKPQFSNDRKERIYELRSYESATDKLYRNKLSMFNDGNEMAIFDRIGSQAVFYGAVLAGSHMPNLMYMTTYTDMKSREEHWKAFGNDPDWKKLSAMPEYQHNVSRNVIEFLVPTGYSDF
ncbi:MAG: NIPSNAP family protein [Pedobacter sp.]|uniref:NIPSNAP family protein n=1 Tax=Pedobacter sp. TaxID=1411316 RepID=UPI0033998353